MTKKHFVALTLKLVALRPRTNSDIESDKIAHAQWYRTVLALADFCQSQNAQFDRERFLQACGITPTPSAEIKCKKCGSPLTQQRYCWNEKCEYHDKAQRVSVNA